MATNTMQPQLVHELLIQIEVVAKFIVINLFALKLSVIGHQ
jgi:hypothetical protein